MTTDWIICKLGDFHEKGEIELTTGPFGTQLKAAEYVKVGTPVINVRNIGFGQIKESDLEYLSKETVNRLSKHLLQNGDIVFGRKGAVERHVYINKNQEGWFQGSDCLRIRVHTEKIDARFLSYSFLTPNHQQWMMNQCSHGSTMSSLNQNILKQIPLYLPPLPVQRKIAVILSAYDDLIENNTRRIKILEEMAQNLYREWFVKFRFPGHEHARFVDSPLGQIPEGWDQKSFSDLVESSLGGGWGSEEPNNKETIPVLIIRGTDFNDIINGLSLRSPRRFITPSSLIKRQLKVGDIIVENSINAKSRCVGTPFLVTDGLLKRLRDPVIAASFCKVYRLKNSSLAPLVFLHMQYLYQEGKMAFYQHVATNGIGNFQSQRFLESEHFIFPSDPCIQKDILELIADLTYFNIANKNFNLRTTRDLLLPKFISGKVDVSDINITVPVEVEA